MKRLISRAAFLAFFALFTVAPVLAQESETQSEPPTAGIFRWLNFAIVIAAIAYYAAKKGGPYFRRKADQIAEKIAEGARARENAEHRRREMEAKLTGLDQEIARMREQAKLDGEAEAQRLRDMSREEAQRIEQTAQAEIAAAERAGHLELKALAARLALERAEALLKEDLSEQADADLFRTFVRELGRSAN